MIRASLLCACAAVIVLWPAAAVPAPSPFEHLAGIIQNTINSLRGGEDDPGDGSAPDVDGPILALPPLQDLVVDRLEVWLNPLYWSTWVQEALLQGNVQIPAPTDIVRPEIWTANVAVDNDPSSISPLPSARRDTSQLSYEWHGQTKTVADFVATTETDTVIFVVNGHLVDEIYNNGYQQHTRQQPWSVTKTFVAAIVGIAYDEGLINSLDDPIESYIDALRGTAYEGASVRNLLQMQSGAFWDEDTPVLVVNTQVEQWVAVLLDYYTGGLVGQTRNEFLMALDKVDEPGTVFRYNSGDTQVLAWMLESLYAKPFNLIMSEKLWRPMGAYGDAKMIADREGSVIASQGLYARAQDFARFGEVLRRGGVTADGRRIVPAYWIDWMTQMSDVSNGRYGFQTWSSSAGDQAFMASGFQGQKITVLPEVCMSAVRLSHSFGLQYRDGDDIFNPDAYGFGTNFSAPEWDAMLRDISKQIGGCDGSSPSFTQAAAQGGSSSGAMSPLPLLLLALLALLRHRRQPR
jgi:CubicO group peptidase (beta-lactamase class C family)